MLSYSSEEVARIFSGSIDKGQLHHAWLVYGDFGIGKTHLCQELMKLLPGSYYSIHKLPSESQESASIITVENIREVKRQLMNTEIQSKYKVLFIDELSLMNANAFNAFLKILEEPIGDTVFVLNTAKINKIPDTIKSRCLKFKLKKKSQEDFFDILKTISGDDLDLTNQQVYELYEFTFGNISLAAHLIQEGCLQQAQDGGDVDYVKILRNFDVNSVENLQMFCSLVYNLMDDLVKKRVAAMGACSLDLVDVIDKIEFLLDHVRDISKTYFKQLVVSYIGKCQKI